MFRRNKRDPIRPRPGPGLVSYLKDGMEILYYGKDIIRLWKRYKDLPGFRVVKTCDGDLRMEWLRLRFQEPARYRLGGESDDKFPGVSQHPNGSWHASCNKDNHFGYYKDIPTAVGVVRDYVLNGIRPKLCKGQCVRDDDQRKDISMSVERLKELCTKKLYVAEIAQELGVSESTVRRYTKQHGIERQDMPIN